MAHARLRMLTDVNDVEQLLTDSHQHPVLLFKHSRSCGTSAEALDELAAHLESEHPSDVVYAMVTVQTHRPVSSAISARLGVRHETPQALLIRNGQVIWSASHFRVTADAVASALAR